MGILYIVRHGESTAQTENRIGGQATFKLSLEGTKQAHLVARELKKLKIDTIYSSKIQRAIDTTNIIINYINTPAHNYVSGYNLLFADWLNERTHGVWDGLSKQEIDSLFDIKTQDTWYDTIYNKSPGGESLDDVYNRVIPKFYTTIYKQLQNSNKTILIVSHKRVMQSLISFIHKQDKNKMEEINVRNATIYNYIIK